MRTEKLFFVICILITLLLAEDTPTYLPQNPGTPLGSRPDISLDYFQQGVYYLIDATFDPGTEIISGSEKLIYTNNSPDTLEFVYFHLYQNAFVPGSYQDIFDLGDGRDDIHTLSPQDQGGNTILSLQDGDGASLSHSIDDTNMKVWLSRPLLPGEPAIFIIEFETKFSGADARMHKGDDYFVATQWYPKMAVYDVRRGWNNDYHLGREFYGDFGTFEWNLTLPADYIVGASGRLLNRDEVLPASLMEKLDVKNFSEKPLGEDASVIIEPTDETKTWVYRADQVHDIAWIASPSFRIGVAEWDGIKVYSFAREQNASKWQDAADVGSLFIEDYSKRWGRYQYHKMIVSDVEDGMEYPMLTADSGTSPGYIGLLGHEIGHNWFYGQIGSNETYRAFLDEGFTNYITATTMDSVWGESSGTMVEGWYKTNFYPIKTRKYIRNDLKYLQFIRTGYEKYPLNTHSDHYAEYANYRLVYSKTGSMLYNLEYALGKGVMDRVMQTYFSTYLFQHPYPEDFTRIAEEVSGKKLDWFFHQWMNETGTIDYAISELNPVKIEDKHYAKLTLKRKGSMEMPLDIRLTLIDGTEKWVHIPNQKTLQKSVPDSWFISKTWVGWNQFNDTFSVDVPVLSPVVKAKIDPSNRLSDIDQLDNVSGKFLPVNAQMDNLYKYYPTLDAYDIYFRPSFTYNSVDGLNPGVHWFSGYLLDGNIRQYHTEGAIRYRSPARPPEFTLFMETPVRFLNNLTHVFVNFEDTGLDRLLEVGYSATVRSTLTKKPYHELELKYREDRLSDTDYLPTWQSWDEGQNRSFVLNHQYHWKRGKISGDYEVACETSVNGSQAHYTQYMFSTIHRINRTIPISIRTFIGWQSDTTPSQMSLRLTGDSFFNSAHTNWMYGGKGSLPASLVNDGHFQVSGGGNIISFIDPSVNLRWLEGINFQADPSQILEKISGYSKITDFISIHPNIFMNCAIYETTIGESNSIVEVGAGITRPLSFIPPALGKYTFRLDGAVPVWGKDADSNWVVSLQKAF
ncbi:MAG: M1 family metallopeptidase [Candidatus Marinimicrobia bacterium]|nr:M1 family metallopeptidase [Candidatus Neomarinimicrobiota bacterium]